MTVRKDNNQNQNQNFFGFGYLLTVRNDNNQKPKPKLFWFWLFVDRRSLRSTNNQNELGDWFWLFVDRKEWPDVKEHVYLPECFRGRLGVQLESARQPSFACECANVSE